MKINRKTVLVTGASRGIGRSIAMLFAIKGYHVYINCNKSINQLKALEYEIKEKTKGSCTMVVGNVGNPREVERIFNVIEKESGCLDVLINNAGIAYIGLLTDMSNKEWNRILQVNLSSVFYCSRAAVPGMVSKKEGRIVNISSMWGTVGASMEAAYSATKSGVNGLTKALAKELAPSNIQVNAIACGAVDTEMNSQLGGQERRNFEEEIPMGRFATADEIASLVYGIVNSPNYMTGQIIGVDGGYI